MATQAPTNRADAGGPSGTVGGSRRGVALLAFSTQSSYGARVDWELLSLGRMLRRRGVPSVLFQVHHTATDEAENAKRTDDLVSRIVSGGFAWVVCLEMWTAELGRRLLDAGIRIVERRATSMPESIHDPSLECITREIPSAQPLDEYRGLVELLGLPSTESVENVDLTIGDACSYQSAIASNPFFAELADDPRFSGHKGCAYCFNGHQPDAADPMGSPLRDKPDRLLDELRTRRAMLPRLKTVWMPFAEVFYDALSEAFDRSAGDAVWQGLTMSMQCRPDVIVKRRADIELLAEKAHRAGTVIKIAVVGFENFSPAELERLNRGVTPEQLASAAGILDSWSHDVRGLEVQGYVPSFILFNPWTSLDDLELNLREIGRHGLNNANVERMRIGTATPLYEMARRAKLTAVAPVRLAVHPNGYFSEAGYSFRDARVAAACEGFDTLKPLGFADQPRLLAAIVDAVRRSEDPAVTPWSRMAATWQSIRRLSEKSSSEAFRRVERQPCIDVRKVIELLADAGVTADAALSRPAPRTAAMRRGPSPRDAERVGLGVGRACNNGCDPCLWLRRLEFRQQAALPVEVPVSGKVVQLAGREPTLVKDLPALVRGLREAGAVRVDMDTNGRRLLYPQYVRALDAAGLDAVTVKLFGADAASWDQHTREPGSFFQTVEAMATLQHYAPGITLTGMIVPGGRAGSGLQELVDFARRMGMTRLRVVIRLAMQDLLSLDELEATLGRLAAAEDGPAMSFVVE